MSSTSTEDGTGVIKTDPWLEPHSHFIRHRYQSYKRWKDDLDKYERGLAEFSLGYKKMGFHVLSTGDITYREWAPNATSAHLIGDFSMTQAGT
jgi:1,4-alpha-glucan branching enzyme